MKAATLPEPLLLLREKYRSESEARREQDREPARARRAADQAALRAVIRRDLSGTPEERKLLEFARLHDTLAALHDDAPELWLEVRLPDCWPIFCCYSRLCHPPGWERSPIRPEGRLFPGKADRLWKVVYSDDPFHPEVDDRRAYALCASLEEVLDVAERPPAGKAVPA